MLFIFSSTQRINIDTYIILYRNPSKAFKSLIFPGETCRLSISILISIYFHGESWRILIHFSTKKPDQSDGPPLRSHPSPIDPWEFGLGPLEHRPAARCHGAMVIDGRPAESQDDPIGGFWRKIWLGNVGKIYGFHITSYMVHSIFFMVV